MFANVGMRRKISKMEENTVKEDIFSNIGKMNDTSKHFREQGNEGIAWIIDLTSNALLSVVLGLVADAVVRGYKVK